MYRPADVPDRFAAPVLIAACRDAESVLLYTVVYRSGEESLAFILNRGFGAWGNIPGPPTSMSPIDVRGSAGTVLRVTGVGNGGTHDFYVVSWQDGDATYEVKVQSDEMPEEDVLDLARDLIQVD